MNRLGRILLLWLGLLSAVRGQAAGYAFNQMPSDLDQVDVYLHTVDIGNMIYTNFGHTALRIHDKVSGRDLVFNWGMFSFKDPINFGLQFYRGILNYHLGIYPYRAALAGYEAEGRKVWEDRIQLTREQKHKLFEQLIFNSQPENSSFAYQYFFDNCSTRIRDHMDTALGGIIKPATHFNHAPQTFRDMVYEGYSYTPGMDLFLDIAMNSNLDRLMTLWERMFHPLYMREVYQQTQNGGMPLLTDSKVLVDFPRPESYPGLSFILVLLFFGVPLSMIGILFFLRNKLIRFLPIIYRVFALISLPLLGFGALVGFLMPVTWLVSDHLDLHHNANMLLFWPIDVILIVWAFALLVQGRGWRLPVKGTLFLRRYVLVHMIVTLSMPVLRLLGLIHQDVNRAIVWVLPPYMVILFLLWRVGTEVKVKVQEQPSRAA
ncbi:MAG TPA: DUF4105 domain-containing protein [Oligoflexus sp.]|uniref:lipoprotein N-acyltransferase Lnb domain-containing protein n=1 Tax=Oligoflexus sp. TaxID=1971216 RepID=UPI002D3A86EF|nr:DUF4105 domain-containing protein [Oligoflexus sp.]HYX35448.1 DUF4105 domain-containing protein [Oligoflexus sp.]